MAAVPATISGHWPLALLSFVYIAAATAVSRGEVHGGKRGIAGLALISLIGVVGVLAAIAAGSGARAVPALALTIVLGWRVLRPFWIVYQDPRPLAIRRAVKAGVLSLVLVDAVISTVYAGPPVRRDRARDRGGRGLSRAAVFGNLMDVIRQEIRVAFSYPVHFTTGVFTASTGGAGSRPE